MSRRKRILNLLPLNHLSWVTGKFADLPLPRPFNQVFVKSFAALVGINPSEATLPIAHYRSIGHFFIRDLRKELRPIEEGLVSPVDGTLRDFGTMRGGQMLQIKGKEYSVESLLASKSWAQRYHDGTYFNLYLSPRDYHHVHAPISGKIVAMSYIPGRLWPVNDWALTNVQNLFSINERLVTYIESDSGIVAVVMVGATNVGKMTVSYDTQITNRFRISRRGLDAAEKVYGEPLSIRAGDRLGTFHLGSTVILLCEKGKVLPRTLRSPCKVQYGRTLAELAARGT